MADPPSPSRSPLPRNPSITLRRRGFPSRASLETPERPQRRNSTLSDTISEARYSIRSSTDDLFLPKVAGRDAISTEESHWHSAPLVLALLPAIAGVLFKNGSVFVTDVTLIVLAGVFLNWSVRLPWDWYRSAQAVQREPPVFQDPHADPIESEEDGNEAAEGSRDDSQPTHSRLPASAEASAIKELQIHELAALASCFIFPVIGTWLLHGIRSSLSRPSEGLVSNYNLTIFLLASEIRPFAHLLKLVQARTLHLQRVVIASEESHIDPSKVQDLGKRLEELEAHVAETAAARLSKGSPAQSPEEAPDAPTLVTQAVAEARHAIQPDIEALNRAVRRYEKRTALTSLQSDTRFQQLEAQTRDAIALAAAAQRSATPHRSSYAFTLIDWACACVVIPTQFALSILKLPARAANYCFVSVQHTLGLSSPGTSRSRISKGKSPAAPSKAQSQSQSQSQSESRDAISPFTPLKKQALSTGRGTRK